MDYKAIKEFLFEENLKIKLLKKICNMADGTDKSSKEKRVRKEKINSYVKQCGKIFKYIYN